MFPTVQTIDDILPFIKNKPEFVVLDKGDYLVIDYNYRTSDTFDTPQACECRGIKFLPNGKLLSRPFHKFFNVGEREAKEINWANKTRIYEKLDGSMIHPALVNNQLVFMTRKGRTEHAILAEKLFLKEYADLCIKYLKIHLLPLFEFTGPANLNVVNYTTNRLVYLNTRGQRSGLYFYIPVGPDQAQLKDANGDASWISLAKNMTEGEGFVVSQDYTKLWKIKADAYVLKHRIKDDFSRKDRVVELIMNDKADDLMPLLSKEQQTKLTMFITSLWSEFFEIKISVETLLTANDFHSYTRKEYAALVQEQEQWTRSVYFSALDGKDWETVLKQTFIKYADKVGGNW